MKTVIAHLNAVIEDRMPTALKPGPAAEALARLEYHDLAIGALRTLIDHPGDAEGLAHAERCIARYDKEAQRRIARLTPPTVDVPDVSDLV